MIQIAEPIKVEVVNAPGGSESAESLLPPLEKGVEYTVYYITGVAHPGDTTDKPSFKIERHKDGGVRGAWVQVTFPDKDWGGFEEGWINLNQVMFLFVSK